MTRTTHPPYTGSLANIGRALDNLFETIEKTNATLKAAHAELDAQTARDIDILESDTERRDQTNKDGKQ